MNWLAISSTLTSHVLGQNSTTAAVTYPDPDPVSSGNADTDLVAPSPASSRLLGVLVTQTVNPASDARDNDAGAPNSSGGAVRTILATVTDAGTAECAEAHEDRAEGGHARALHLFEERRTSRSHSAPGLRPTSNVGLADRLPSAAVRHRMSFPDSWPWQSLAVPPTCQRRTGAAPESVMINMRGVELDDDKDDVRDQRHPCSCLYSLLEIGHDTVKRFVMNT